MSPVTFRPVGYIHQNLPTGIYNSEEEFSKVWKITDKAAELEGIDFAKEQIVAVSTRVSSAGRAVIVHAVTKNEQGHLAVECFKTSMGYNIASLCTVIYMTTLVAIDRSIDSTKVEVAIQNVETLEGVEPELLPLVTTINECQKELSDVEDKISTVQKAILEHRRSKRPKEEDARRALDKELDTLRTEYDALSKRLNESLKEYGERHSALVAKLRGPDLHVGHSVRKTV